MLLRRSLDFLFQSHRGSVVTLGNFDGVHRGHQCLIRKTRSYAKLHHLRSVMLTFDPMPAEFFFPQQSPARLMRWIEKWQFLQSSPVDEFYVLPFQHKMAEMSAINFIQEVLVQRLQVKKIFVGDDFRFGCQRQGDVTLLRQYGSILGYTVETHTEYEDGQAISSTRVRQALALGNFTLATKLLGHPYKNFGRVVYGSQLGRKLGCPTANIPMRRKLSPLHGIYVVQVEIEQQIKYGIASVGSRPTVGGDPAFLLEVHLFDFQGDLYGQRLQVQYLYKLRDEWMFDSLNALKQQIAIDCQLARDYLQQFTIARRQ